MITVGLILFGILICINTAVYVMVQMYFEGHPAFNGEEI